MEAEKERDNIKVQTVCLSFLASLKIRVSQGKIEENESVRVGSFL